MLATWLARGQKLLFFWVEVRHHASHRYRLCHPGMSSLITHGELATFKEYLNIWILEHFNSSVNRQIWARHVREPWPGTDWKGAILSVLFSKDPFLPWERSTLQWTFQGLFSGGQELWILNCPQRGVIPSDVSGFPQNTCAGGWEGSSQGQRPCSTNPGCSTFSPFNYCLCKAT